jgi:hypothetical protein
MYNLQESHNQAAIGSSEIQHSEGLGCTESGEHVYPCISRSTFYPCDYTPAGRLEQTRLVLRPDSQQFQSYGGCLEHHRFINQSRVCSLEGWLQTHHRFINQSRVFSLEGWLLTHSRGTPHKSRGMATNSRGTPHKSRGMATNSRGPEP